MDRGAWQATVHGVAELDMTDRQELDTIIVFGSDGIFCWWLTFYWFKDASELSAMAQEKR